MSATIDKQRILPFLYIITILNNKIQGLNNNYNLPEISAADENLISTILLVNKCTNLDFHKLNSQSEIIEYQTKAREILNKNILTNGESNIVDEIYLIKNSNYFNTKILANEKFVLSELVKDTLKHINIPATNIESWLKSPDYVRVFENTYSKNFLCTKKIKLMNGVEKIIFYHINKYLNHSDVDSLFIYNYRNFPDMLNNPIRFFLDILDNYGNDIITDKGKSRFILQENSNSLHLPHAKPENNNKNGMICTQFSGSNILNTKSNVRENTIYFVYSVDTTKYILDYKNNIV
jgi:hypothetical protein